MMVVNKNERSLIEKILSQNYTKGKILDMFSYDGSLLGCFPKKPFSLDLSKETADYTAVLKKSNPVILKEKLPFDDNSISLVTILLKLESIPSRDYGLLFKEAYRVLVKGGKLVIISRKRFSLYGAMYSVIKAFFKDDIRKSGIFTCFGPYQPIKLPVKELRKKGFDVKVSSFYLIPPVLEDYYSLFKQYINAGNTYLDSVKKKTLPGSVISLFAKLTKNLPGSLGVIIATK